MWQFAGRLGAKPTITPTVDNAQVVSGLKQAQKETKSLWERFTANIFGSNLIRMGTQKVIQAIHFAVAVFLFFPSKGCFHPLHDKPLEIQLPNISPHILRHMACCRFAESGCDLKVLQYLMGQTDIRITMGVYNHVDLGRVKRELDKLKNLDQAAEKFTQNFTQKPCEYM